jgi:predicted glutamine amidotransferase
MCRALLYLGEPVLLDNFLYQPDSALVRQSYMPKMLNLLNLAGFGLRAWDPSSNAPEQPYSYYSQQLPVFDRNLKHLAEKVRAACLLAHVRGVAYHTRVEISLQNCHPFHFSNVPLVLAHNGDLARFAEMKPLLASEIKPVFLSQIHGTTDSEWVYALVVSQLSEPYRHAGADELAAGDRARHRHHPRRAQEARHQHQLLAQPVRRRRRPDRGGALLLRLRPLPDRRCGAPARGKPELSQPLVHRRAKLRAARRRMEDDRRLGQRDLHPRGVGAAHSGYRGLGGSSGVRAVPGDHPEEQAGGLDPRSQLVTRPRPASRRSGWPARVPAPRFPGPRCSAARGK